jgi:hypothetical protein
MSETAETAPPLSLDADSSNDSILEQFDNFSEALTAATLVLTVDVNTQHLECKIIALEKEKQKLKAEIYDTKAVASAELSVLETEKRHVIETLHETFDLKTGLLEQQCATLRMELFKCKTERNSNRESCAHVQDGEAPTASAASTVQADIRLLEAQLVQRSAALEELKKVTDVRVGNATEAHRAATEKADALHAGLTGLTTEIIAAEDLFKSLYGTAWTATLRSSYKPRRKDNSAAVVLRALIQLSADRLASLSATQPGSSSTKSSSSNALCAGAVSRAELVAPVANRASGGRPASAVPHSSSNTSTALAPHAEINHICTFNTGVTNNGRSHRGASGPFSTLGRTHFASILVGPHSQFWLARDTILGVASTIGQVVSTFPVGQSWKVTYASSAVARRALTEVNWAQMYPAASREPGRLDCRPYREVSVPVLQRCVYVTFHIAKYVRTGDGLAQALSTLGDVLAVFQIPAGFCVEFSAQATAQAVLQSFRANGAVVIPLCEEHVRPFLLQLRSSGDRTGEFHFLARSPHDRDTHSLAAWFRTAYCFWACDSLATAASRMAMLSEYAQFCTVTVTATKEPISTERVKRLACMVGEVVVVGGEGRVRNVTYATAEAARQAVGLNWNILGGEANSAKWEPFRDSSVSLEERCVLPTSLSDLGSTSDVLQELRKCGEVVDAVRLNEKVLIVEFSRALSGAVLRRLERTCFAAQLIFPACVLQVTTALASLGAELAREEARGGGETLTQHCRWLGKLQFSLSLSGWLRDKLHALRNQDTVELSEGESSCEFAWSDDSVASDSSRDTPVGTRRAAIGGKRKAEAAAVPQLLIMVRT